MSISSYLNNKTNMINKRCEDLIDEIYTEYKNGELSTELDYIYKAKNTIKDFYTSVGKPSFVYTKAISTPVSEHYNNMVNKAYNDINLAITETNSLNESISLASEESESQISTYNSILNKIEGELDIVENNIKSLKSESQYVFSDTFNSLDYIRNISSKESVDVRQTEGVITLRSENEKNYSNSVEMEILKGSNGFPGNTHEIETLNNKICFKGQNDARVDLSNMIDGEKTTWFEYELFNINNSIYEKTNGFGFSYSEGLTWITKENKLILKLKISLKEEKVCNWISLTPFLSDSKNSQGSIIKKVVITDGNFLTQEYRPNKNFKDTYVINFEPQYIKDIIIDFEQNSFYETNIGHIYTIKNNTDDLFFDVSKDELYKRVDLYKPSVTSLGIKFDPNTNSYILPKYNSENNTYNHSELVKEYFTIPFNYDKYDNNIEILKANRYMIGIKNINIGNYTYLEESVYVSKKFTTDENITFVELEANDFIPSEFKKYREDLDSEFTGEDFLKYEITFDEGNIWYPIKPKHRVRFGQCAYAINSDILPSMRRNYSVKYIDRFLDTKSITLRITLKRPELLIYDTPIVYNYKISVKTERNDFYAYD